MAALKFPLQAWSSYLTDNTSNLELKNSKTLDLIELENIFAIALAFFIVTVSPDPANIAVATVSMSSGRRSGLFYGMGLSVGLAFWGLVAATGMGAVLQSTSTVLIVFKILGGLYLLWLAYQSARSAMQKTEDPATSLHQGRWFWRGLILNLSNPKAVIAWLAALSMGLGGDANGASVVAATSVCIILGFLNYAGHALAFSLSGFMAGYKRTRKWVDGVVAGLFVIAGLSLIRSAFSR